MPVATRGSVSAEFAVLTPTVLALLALALSLLTSVIDRAHLSATTMWAARSLSMGESESEVTKRVAHSVGVNDDAVSITHRADEALTCVAVTRPARPPASLLGITIEAFSCVPLIAWRGVR